MPLSVARLRSASGECLTVEKASDSSPTHVYVRGVKPRRRKPAWRRLKYDLFYIETRSLRTDAKILLQTVRTALMGKGQ